MKSTYKLSKVLNKHGLRAVFLSIAELNGYKLGTIKGKLSYGINCWLTNKLHDLHVLERHIDLPTPELWAELKPYLPKSLSTEWRESHLEKLSAYQHAETRRAEADQSELHENIWLERIYDGLDKHFNVTKFLKAGAVENRDLLLKIASKHSQSTFEWNIPIELDATASMLQWYGILLGDERLLLKTNVIVKNGVLNDAWTINGIPRTQYKYSCTPRLYGSSQECYEIWQDKGIQYTMEQVNIFNEEISKGALGVADAYKTFLIDNCNPTEVMKLKVFNDEFTVECNRYRNVGDYTTIYDIFDTQTNRIQRILNTKTKRIADLEQFRRYFPTGLIHNIDSQAANYVSEKAMEKYGWLIDIYDAFIVHPNMARDIRKWYNEFQKTIYTNKDTILADYHASLGITNLAEFDKVKALVHPIVGDFQPHYMALK